MYRRSAHFPTNARRSTLGVGAAILAAASLCAVVAPGANGAAKASATAAGVVPKPYKVENQVKVDLDGDGDLDVAMVAVDGPVPLKEIDPNSDSEGNRLLVIARKDSDGYRLVGKGANALMCRTCGGAFWGIVPAPIELTAKKNTLVVFQEAGSREMSDYTHRYRIEKDRVRLIGSDIGYRDRGDGSNYQVSTNYLTGLSITTVDGTPEGAPKAGTVKGKPSVVYLENVELY